MQNTAGSIRPVRRDATVYRESLSPSLWAMISAAVVAPMAALVLTPIDTTIALIVGALVGVAFIALLVASSPVVQIRDGVFTAGRAKIDVAFLGDSQALEGEEARAARGAGLHPRAWHTIRGGIEGVVMVNITDPDDPTPYWVVSSRTPDRLVAALRRAQAMQRTPRK